MTIVEAIENALLFLEANGYKSGDIHDDLVLAIVRLRQKHSRTVTEKL